MGQSRIIAIKPAIYCVCGILCCLAGCKKAENASTAGESRSVPSVIERLSPFFIVPGFENKIDGSLPRPYKHPSLPGTKVIYQFRAEHPPRDFESSLRKQLTSLGWNELGYSLDDPTEPCGVWRRLPSDGTRSWDQWWIRGAELIFVTMQNDHTATGGKGDPYVASIIHYERGEAKPFLENVRPTARIPLKSSDSGP